MHQYEKQTIDHILHMRSPVAHQQTQDTPKLVRKKVQFIKRVKKNTLVAQHKQNRTKYLKIFASLTLLSLSITLGLYIGIPPLSLAPWVTPTLTGMMLSISTVLLLISLGLIVRKLFDLRETTLSQKIDEVYNEQATVTLVPGTGSGPTLEGDFKDEDHRGIPATHYRKEHIILIISGLLCTALSVGIWQLCKTLGIPTLLTALPLTLTISCSAFLLLLSLLLCLNFNIGENRFGFARRWLNWASMPIGLSKPETDQDVFLIEKNRILDYFSKKRRHQKTHTVSFNGTLDPCTPDMNNQTNRTRKS